jgi:hypothetical protein
MIFSKLAFQEEFEKPLNLLRGGGALAYSRLLKRASIAT